MFYDKSNDNLYSVAHSVHRNTYKGKGKKNSNIAINFDCVTSPKSVCVGGYLEAELIRFSSQYPSLPRIYLL